MEYDLESRSVTFYFGPIAATTQLACSVNNTNFENCKLSPIHVQYRISVIQTAFSLKQEKWRKIIILCVYIMDM